MRSATDSALATSRRLLGLAIVVTACAIDSGCSQLQAFRTDVLPTFGTTLSSRPKNRPTQSADLYAERFGDVQSQTAIARRDASSSDRTRALASADPERGSAPGTTVTLDAPVPLPTASDHLTSVASRTQRPDWMSADEVAAATPRRDQPASATTTSPPAAPPTESDPSVESLVAATRARLNGLTNYQVHLNRQERVGSTLLPAESVVLSIRRNPKAVRLEWPEGAHKGREVIYSATEHDGLMHVNMADSIVPVPRLSIAPDSPMVLKNSRHPITEAGFDTIIHNLEISLEKSKNGDPSGGKLSYGGLEQPAGVDRPCHKIVRVTPTGEMWLVYLDPNTQFPAMIQGNAANGDLLERYAFSAIKPNLADLASRDAFNPNQRWGEPRGLLSRLARGANGRNTPESATR